MNPLGSMTYLAKLEISASGIKSSKLTRNTEYMKRLSQCISLSVFQVTAQCMPEVTQNRKTESNALCPRCLPCTYRVPLQKTTYPQTKNNRTKKTQKNGYTNSTLSLTTKEKHVKHLSSKNNNGLYTSIHCILNLLCKTK
jgi:hypothetical protein